MLCSGGRDELSLYAASNDDDDDDVVLDRKLKPNVEERRSLERIINSPAKHFNLDDKLLLWRHRFSLVDNKRALTKVLRVVEWSDKADRAEVQTTLRVCVPSVYECGLT